VNTHATNSTHNPLEYVENFLIDKLNENTIEILKYFENNKQEIIDDFLLHFLKLCRLVYKEQAIGFKAPIAYMHIGFLRSSLLTKSYEFRLGMHDENFWLDTDDTSVYWKADFFFQYVEPDTETMQQMVKPYPHISEYEVYEISYRYAQCYLIPATRQIIQDIMIEVFKIPELNYLKLDKNLSIVFGGYMEGGNNI